ncbi:MAG: hypothetical protein WC374_11410 [Phycisphaerae bacterium]|jgi:hypothetical protein
MYGEVLQAVRTLAISYATPYTTIDVGSTPSANGLAMYLGAGAPDAEDMNRGSRNTIFITLNGKDADQQKIVTTLSAIHKALNRLKDFPAGADWEILNIKTSAAPGYIEQESSGQWLYGSILTVEFYLKGV